MPARRRFHAHPELTAREEGEDRVNGENGAVIRPLRREEIPLLREFLYLAVFVPEGEAPPDRSIVDLPELRVYTDGFGDRAGDVCMAAEAGGRVIGAAWARIMDDYGHLDDETPSLAISLDPGHRGRGTGTRLLGALLDALAAQGYERVSLSVQRANRAARLYRRAGFCTVRENGGELIMVRGLTPAPREDRAAPEGEA